MNTIDKIPNNGFCNWQRPKIIEDTKPVPGFQKLATVKSFTLQILSWKLAGL